MTQVDTVYYQDGNIQITSRDLRLGTTTYSLDSIKSAKIETLAVRKSPLPDKLVGGLAVLYLGLLGAGLLNFFAQQVGLGIPQDLLRAIGVPLLLLVLLVSLGKAVIELRGSREVAEIPLIRFKRAAWLQPDIAFASLDRAYLRRLIASINQVLNDKPPAPPADPPPVVQLQDGKITVGDQVYALSDVHTISYSTAMSPLSWWLSAFIDVVIPAMLLSFLLESDPAIRPVASTIRAFLTFGIIIVNALTARTGHAYAVYLIGPFGTAYIFATTDVARAAALVKRLKAQLPSNLSCPLSSRFGRRTLSS